MNRAPFSPKLFEIAAQTYRQHLTRRGFLFFAFVLPVLCPLLSCAFLFWWLPSPSNQLAFGMVDESGLFATLRAGAPDSSFRIQRFDDVAAAETAWRGGALDGYVVVTRDYLQSGQVRVVSRIETALFARGALEQFLRAQLLKKSAPAQRARILDGTLVLHAASKPTENFSWERVGMLLVALGLVLLYYFLNQFTQSYLWLAVSAEHENQTIEIMLTSVSLQEFFGGKVLGIALTGLTPIVVWGGLGGMVFLLVAAFLQWFELSFGAWSGWSLVAVGILILVPAYIMHATTTIVVGALYGGLEQNRPLPWFLDLFQTIVFFPLMLAGLFAPDSALAVGLSFIPWTAPIVLIMRMGLTTVPLWQSIPAILLTWLAMILTFALSTRVYRLLRAGRANLTWRRVVTNLFVSLPRGGKRKSLNAS
ncbi:MAG: ABC transporter permease [Chloroflexi bacterium]|nr:ABC transporter permease [Chloroflexota bacterium]